MNLSYMEFKIRLLTHFLENNHEVFEKNNDITINYGIGSCQIDLLKLFEEVQKDNVKTIKEVYESLMNVLESTSGIFTNEIVWSNVYPVIRGGNFHLEYKDVFVNKPFFQDLRVYLVELLDGQYLRYIRLDEVNNIEDIFANAMTNLKSENYDLVELEKDIFILNNFDGFSASRILLPDVIRIVEENFGEEHAIAFPDDGAFYIVKSTSKNIRRLIKLMKQDSQDRISTNIYEANHEKGYHVLDQRFYDFRVIK